MSTWQECSEGSRPEIYSTWTNYSTQVKVPVLGVQKAKSDAHGGFMAPKTEGFSCFAGRWHWIEARGVCARLRRHAQCRHVWMRCFVERVLQRCRLGYSTFVIPSGIGIDAVGFGRKAGPRSGSVGFKSTEIMTWMKLRSRCRKQSGSGSSDLVYAG
jgi:hypothetical protein